MSHQPEREIGEWKRSVKTWGFWWRTITTLGMYYFLLWNRNKIVVTTRRVHQRRGNVLGGTETSMSVENITDVSLDVPPLGAVFNYGNVEIQSAGSGEAEIYFTGLAGARKLREVIFDMKDGQFDDE